MLQASGRRVISCATLAPDNSKRTSESANLDIRGETATRADLYAADSYAASQAFGEAARKAGEDGILFESVRLTGGENVVAYRPRNVRDVLQADHFEIVVQASGRLIDARRLRVEA